MESLLHYKQDGYLDINGFLRNSPLPVPINLNENNKKEYLKKLKIKNKDYEKTLLERLEHIKNIDSYMNYNTTSKTYYRGYSHMGDTFENLLKENGSLISKGYSSTSYDTSIAENFINGKGKEGDAILSFKIPMDIKAFDFEPLEKKNKHLEQEKELLLERNIEFEIIDKLDGIYIAKLRKYDPFKSKELKEIEKIKKEISKMKAKNADEEKYKKDIKEFMENDYDGGDLEDAFLDFSLLYTVDPNKEEMIQELFMKMMKKGGRRKKNKKVKKEKNIFKILKRMKAKRKLKN